MTDNKKVVKSCEFFDICKAACDGTLDDIEMCSCYEIFKQLKRKEQELEEACKAFDIEYVIDKETGDLFGRCNKLYKKEQECDKLYIQLKADEEYHKEEENTLRKIIKNKEERNIELYKENNKLEQALDEIEEIAKYNNFLVRDPFCGTGYRDLSGQILNIIKRAKEK